MADTLRDVMTDNPATLESSASAIEAVTSTRVEVRAW